MYKNSQAVVPDIAFRFFTGTAISAYNIVQDRERLLIEDMDLAESAVIRANRPYTNLHHPDYYL